MKQWCRSVVRVVVLGGVLVAPWSLAEAALSANLTLTAETQGQIRGSVTQKGREGTIKVVAFNHEVVSPRDAASGLPTGKRQHKPLVVTVELDKASPLLQNVLVNNENLTTLELRVYLPLGKGGETLAYSVRLRNASISAIKLVSDVDGKVSQVVSFTYRKIEWVWHPGGIVSEDDWEQIVAVPKKKK